MKQLVLLGEPIDFDAPANDQYLETMASTGPIDVLPVLRACCNPNDNVIDVGANIGITAVLSGLLVNPGQVIAIEPVPETFRHLRNNIDRSKLPNV